MNDRLERYLNDHLAGATGALVMIDDVTARQTDATEERFFRDLKSAVEEDRRLLKRLLKSADLKESSVQKMAGGLTARAGRLKLLWEGMDPGELGIFEALEMLVLGIQGKRILWLMLGDIAPLFPEWSDVDFPALERKALAQRDAVEQRRRSAGRLALAPGAPV
ncbi:hypothetical protein [Luteolibacter sp. Populi]|uniref:hypothetical protein n=1 Tax=Luteolibacter sp. Populi TaxID=3230487 RepID=UPI00346544AB